SPLEVSPWIVPHGAALQRATPLIPCRSNSRVPISRFGCTSSTTPASRPTRTPQTLRRPTPTKLLPFRTELVLSQLFHILSFRIVSPVISWDQPLSPGRTQNSYRRCAPKEICHEAHSGKTSGNEKCVERARRHCRCCHGPARIAEENAGHPGQRCRTRGVQDPRYRSAHPTCQRHSARS